MRAEGGYPSSSKEHNCTLLALCSSWALNGLGEAHPHQ